MSAVAEAALQPRLREYDVEEAKHAVEALVADRAAEPAAAVEDALHAAAFGAGSPLGRPLLLTPAALHGVTAEAVRAHLAACYTPGRMVLAGTNVPHADLKAMADHFFGPPPAAAAGGAAAPAAAGARSAWVGGERLSRVPGSPLATVAVAFPAPHAGDAAGAAAAAVLRALLGEGEGAGARARRPARHSAIARAVHTEAHSFIRAARAINAAYADAGLIGVVGEAADADAGRLAAALAGFVKAAAAAPPTPAALAAAKAAVKLRLAAAAEGAGSAAGALGERAGAGATPAPLAERLAAVDAVTAAGVQAVARAAVAAPPAVAAHGSLDAFPRYDQVVSLIAA